METLVQSAGVEPVSPATGPLKRGRRRRHVYFPAIAVLGSGFAIPTFGGLVLKPLHREAAAWDLASAHIAPRDTF